MINLINRNDNDEIGVASNYSTMRFWSTDFVIKEFEKLIKMGVVRALAERDLLPDEEVLRAGGKDAALDALFSGPSLDDNDDLYDVPEWLTRE